MAEAPSVPSDGDLTEAAQHVSYEIMMCATAAARLARVHAGDDGAERNAYLESALTHARNMNEFLLGAGRPHDDDITRTQFAPAWTPDAADSVVTAAADAMKRRNVDIHKHLAHLTWKRVTGSVDWTIVEVAQDALTVYAAWVAHVEAAAGMQPYTTMLRSGEQQARDLIGGLLRGEGIDGIQGVTVSSTTSSTL